MFMAPRKPRAPINKGSEKENSAEVKIPYKDIMESKAPEGIIKKDKALPIFLDAIKTSSVSTPVVSLRSFDSRFPKEGASTTISFFFRFGIQFTTTC